MCICEYDEAKTLAYIGQEKFQQGFAEGKAEGRAEGIGQLLPD